MWPSGDRTFQAKGSTCKGAEATSACGVFEEELRTGGGLSRGVTRSDFCYEGSLATVLKIGRQGQYVEAGHGSQFAGPGSGPMQDDA